MVGLVNTVTPSAFPYRQAMARPAVRRVRKLAKGLTGKDVFPTTEQIEAFCGDMHSSDPSPSGSSTRCSSGR